MSVSTKRFHLWHVIRIFSFIFDVHTSSFVKYTLFCNTQNSALNLTCEMPLNPKSLLPGISEVLGEFHWCAEYIYSLLSSLWILYECLDLRMRCGQHLGGGDGCVQVFHGAAVCLQHVPVEWGCNKSVRKTCSNIEIGEGKTTLWEKVQYSQPFDPDHHVDNDF